MAEGRDKLLRWALESGLALIIMGMVLWLWPRLDLPRMGREDLWFALGWLVLLAGPASLRLASPFPQAGWEDRNPQAELAGHAAYLLAGLFLAFLLAGPHLGNHKLWLGLVYLAGVVLRLAGAAADLRAAMAAHKGGELAHAGAAAALAALACLLIIPWVRPDLVGRWPSQLLDLMGPTLAALLWGAISGSLFLLMRLLGGRQRVVWLVYLAVGLGPGAALAVCWFPLVPLGLCLAGLLGLIGLRLISSGWQITPRAEVPTPLGLYWLLRALVLLWWGAGLAVALASAWWQPALGNLFSQSLWLRALGLGGFLVVCLGLLAEYSLPLLGSRGLGRLGPGRKRVGVILSSLALLIALAPLLLVNPSGSRDIPLKLQSMARAELLKEPISLSPAHAEVTLTVPSWLDGLRRIYVVSLLTNGAPVEQGAVVAQLMALDESDLPYIYTLRAGIDTAEWALEKREVATTVQHRLARPAESWIVYTLTGEAFTAHYYVTGLYLGREVERLKSIRLRYVYQPPAGQPAPTLEVKRILVN